MKALFAVTSVVVGFAFHADAQVNPVKASQECVANTKFTRSYCECLSIASAGIEGNFPIFRLSIARDDSHFSKLLEELLNSPVYDEQRFSTRAEKKAYVQDRMVSFQRSLDLRCRLGA